MDSKNNQNLDDLTQSLLKKCEVSTLDQLYHKWVKENDNSVPIKWICSAHKNFNENKVLQDMDNIHNLIAINILDYTQKNNLNKEKFLIDYIGMGKILKSLKRKKIIKKNMPLKEIMDKMGIEKKQKDVLISLIEQSIKNKIIFAKLAKVDDKAAKNNNYILAFFSKLKDPEHKKNFIYLIITIIITIVSLSILLPIIYFINA